jgi:regulator of protease activity HflC (stomatin/prohibitin superfamily)
MKAVGTSASEQDIGLTIIIALVVVIVVLAAFALSKPQGGDIRRVGAILRVLGAASRSLLRCFILIESNVPTSPMLRNS